MGKASFWDEAFPRKKNEASLGEAHALAEFCGATHTAPAIHQAIASCFPESGYAVMSYDMNYSTHYGSKFHARRWSADRAVNCVPEKKAIARVAAEHADEIKEIHTACFLQCPKDRKEEGANRFRQQMQQRFTKRPPSYLEKVLEDVDELGSVEYQETTRQALVDARIGQGKFREQVLASWDQRCAVTGSALLPAIRASHIKPWRESNHEERLDPDNGIPLIANLDALFDSGLISFSDAGDMLVSNQLDSDERSVFSTDRAHLRSIPSEEMKTYLVFHRNNIFLRD